MRIRIVCVYLLVFLTMSFIALAEDSRWAKEIRAGEWVMLNSVERTFDGGFVAGGHTDNALFFIRLSSSAKLDWAKTYGGKGARGYMTLQTSDGGLLFVGSVRRNALVVKLDSAGNILWQKTYGTSVSNDAALSVIQAADGGFFVLGNSVRSRLSDVWCMKLKSTGTISWQKRYGNNKSFDRLSDAIGTSEGGLIFVGSTNVLKDGAKGARLGWVVKLNKNGGIMWQEMLDPTSSFVSGVKNVSPKLNTVSTRSDGGYVVGGTIEMLVFGWTHWIPNSKGWVAKLDSQRNPAWHTAFRELGASSTEVRTVRQEKDGYILVTGGWHDIWTARLDSIGRTFWQTGFGKADEQYVYHVSASHDTPTDGTVFVGSMEAHALIARTLSNGMTCHGFQEPTEILSNEISMAAAQPAHVRIKENAFVMQDAHLTQAAASVEIINLCSK